MNDQRFSIAEAIKTGWHKTLGNIGSFFVILLITWAVSALTNSIAASHGGTRPTVTGGLISFLGWILLVLLQMGFLRAVLKVLDGEKPALADFSSTAMQFWNFAVAGLLTGLAVAVGLVLLVIPGIIVAVRLQFYPYFVIDQKLGPIKALQRSWEATKGETVHLFLFLLALICIGIAGLLLFGIGLFVAVPLVTIAAAYAYRKLAVVPPAQSTIVPEAVPAV